MIGSYHLQKKMAAVLSFALDQPELVGDVFLRPHLQRPVKNMIVLLLHFPTEQILFCRSNLEFCSHWSQLLL